MKKKSFTIVTTTINVPALLKNYALDAKRFEHNLNFIVIGDRKTPPDAAKFCHELEVSTGISCRFVSVQEQETYLSRWPEFASFLPWNCIQRRNVGLLMAYEAGADITVTIDDDNLLCQSDYLGFHAHLGNIQEVEAVDTQSGWWNVCKMLQDTRGIPFYHRGHPLSKRWTDDEHYETKSTVKARVVVNAGLWLDDPDVDAMTRLYFPVQARTTTAAYRDKIACNIGTWAPFNSQNTALLTELIPAYLLFPHIGRYDDIWASYVVRHISDWMGDLVTYGAPLVRQKRNPHNLFKDLDAERLGMENNDTFLQALRACTLKSKTYLGAFAEIAEQFPESIKKACETNKTDLELFANVTKGLRLWSGIFKTLK